MLRMTGTDSACTTWSNTHLYSVGSSLSIDWTIGRLPVSRLNPEVTFARCKCLDWERNHLLPVWPVGLRNSVRKEHERTNSEKWPDCICCFSSHALVLQLRQILSCHVCVKCHHDTTCRNYCSFGTQTKNEIWFANQGNVAFAEPESVFSLGGHHTTVKAQLYNWNLKGTLLLCRSVV